MPQVKSSRVNVSLTPEEYNRCKETAESLDMTLPAFIRYCVNIYFSARKRRERHKNK